MFFDEFPEFMDLCNSLSGSAVIVGDVNFHFDNQSNPNTAKLIDILDNYSFSQSVNEPTQDSGHILDWIMFRPLDRILQSTAVTHALTSDHFCVVCDLNVTVPSALAVFREGRNLRRLDLVAFKEDLRSAVSPSSCPTVEQLNTTLHSVLDKHAPVGRMRVRSSKSAPWYPAISDDLRAAKRQRRQAERRWLQTGRTVTVFKQIFAAAKRFVAKLVHNARIRYFSDKITSSKSSKDLFNVCRHLSLSLIHI